MNIGRISSAKILIQHGADVNSVTRFNVRPLSTAATKGMQIIKLD